MKYLILISVIGLCLCACGKPAAEGEAKQAVDTQQLSPELEDK